jgi:transposase
VDNEDKGKIPLFSQYLKHLPKSSRPFQRKEAKTMGKGKLGLRGRLFHDILGEGFSPEQLLIMAIDTAKFQPKTAIFSYFGEMLHNSFFFTPDRYGIDELCKTAEKVLRDTKKQKLIFGVENTGHYHEIIVRLLKERNQIVMLINANTTAQERKSLLDYSKNDDLDLYAIASAIAGGKVIYNQGNSDHQAKLQFLTRTRRTLVRERSLALITIRTILDHYWPQLQGVVKVINSKPTIEKVFEDLSVPMFISFLRLLPTPADVLALGTDGLLEFSHKHQLRLGINRVDLIMQASRLAEPVSENLLQLYVQYVKELLDDLERLNRRIESFEEQMEALLVRTRGILLLSTGQIGVVTAAEFMSEVGLKIDKYSSSLAVIKLAGTNPVPDESAGHKGQMKISDQGNPWFREVVYTIGKNLSEGRYTNPYFAKFRNQLSCRFPKQKRIAVGNKFIRVAFAMLTKGEQFNPETWDGPCLTVDPLRKLRAINREVASQTMAEIATSRV